MSTARNLATDRIAKRAQRFPDLDLAPIDTADLEPRDAGLAKAIDHLVARRWLTLAAVCDAKLTQPWDRLEPPVQAPLLVGAAQLLFMERVPDHAIVSEAVAWTKKNARTKAGGLVNAVLRRVAELRDTFIDRTPYPMQREHLPFDDGRAWLLTEPVFDENPLTRLAQQTSHPIEILTRWMTSIGEKAMTELALHNLVHPPIIVTGIAHSAASESPGLIRHDSPGFYVFTDPREELDHLLERHAGARVQDPATAHAIDSIAGAIEKPRLIIDLCAGKGTKTRQLAAMFPEARIIACDIDPARQAVLCEVFGATRPGSQNVEVVEFETVRQFDPQADLLVIDAPCSNSGVLARRVEARYRLTKPYLEKVAAVQRQLLADSIPLLAPGGSILYITCSIEREENEHQAAWLSKWHGMNLMRESTLMPRGRPGEAPTGYADGGYAALLWKPRDVAALGRTRR